MDDNHQRAMSDNPAPVMSDKGGLSDTDELVGFAAGAASEAAATLGLPAVIVEAGTPIAASVMDADLKADIDGAYALNTRRAYRADWADWCAWCQRNGKRPLPAEPRALRDYLVDLAAGRKVSTLKRRLAAIGRAHKLAGHQLDRLEPAIYHAMRRLAREKGAAPRGRAELMTGDILAMLKVAPKSLRGTRDRAILLLTFAGGLRRSEVVDLDVNDVDWRRDGIAVQIRRSKTDQEGLGQVVLVEYGKREATCPVRALKRWLQESQICDGPIFRPVEAERPTARRLNDKMVWHLVKRYAARAGLDPTRLGAHSLRVGHVTQALANGADAIKAKDQLRHRRLETTLGYNRGRSFKDNTSGKLGL
jgi:site-specific recombinase XerD